MQSNAPMETMAVLATHVLSLCLSVTCERESERARKRERALVCV
jgi:hypothetical protein